MLFLIALLATPACIALLAAHKFTAAAIGYFVLSCVVDALPPVTSESSAAYRFCHALLNALAANGFRFLIALYPRLAELFPNGLQRRSNPTES